MANKIEDCDRNQQNFVENMNGNGLRQRNYQSSSTTNSQGVFYTNFGRTQDGERYKNAREYAAALRPWIQHYNYMNQMRNFYSMNMAMSCMNGFGLPPSVFPVNNGHTTTPTTTPTNGWNQTQTDSSRTSTATNNSEGSAAVGGRLYRVPTFWRRVAAELIDFTLLFYIKLLVTLFVMKRFGHNYDVIDYQELLSLDEVDYDKVFAITTEVIAMEIVNRLLITIFETMCLRHGIGTVGGATPGKRLLGLKLISGHQITDHGNGLIFVSPATDVGWKGAFVRSAIKNFTIAFFLPACLTLFFHSYNRTIYDVVTKTIVVQKVDRRAEY